LYDLFLSSSLPFPHQKDLTFTLGLPDKTGSKTFVVVGPEEQQKDYPLFGFKLRSNKSLDSRGQ